MCARAGGWSGVGSVLQCCYGVLIVLTHHNMRLHRAGSQGLVCGGASYVVTCVAAATSHMHA
jgi:hypothetical protein